MSKITYFNVSVADNGFSYEITYKDDAGEYQSVDYVASSAGQMLKAFKAFVAPFTKHRKPRAKKIINELKVG